MFTTVLEQVKYYVSFGDDDAEQLRQLGQALRLRMPALVERCLTQIISWPGTEGAFETPDQVMGVRQELVAWFRRLFSGHYDADFAADAARLGRNQLRDGLPQQFLVAALELVKLEVEREVAGLALPNLPAAQHALRKLLILETALLLDGYREVDTHQVRQHERDAVQARLREAEQLAHIGQLAASLAHEIKNPLAGISGAIQVIRAGLKPSDPHFPVLGEVLRQIHRLDRTVKDLLIYARPRPPRYQRCDLPRAIERVLALLGKEPEFASIRFEFSIAHDLPPLAADEHLLEQLLMNLLLNAAQASTVSGLVRLVATCHGADVRLSIVDEGAGMSEEVARRALEPFFTTKARGTGLGLPICQKIVEAHGGALEIESRPGAGTEVAVTLPASLPSAAVGVPDEHTRTDR